jgi:hypothetical protein
MSDSFDFGDFSQGNYRGIFNDRQLELIYTMFTKEKQLNIPVVERLCFQSANFARLWWGLLEYSLGEPSAAIYTLRSRINSWRLAKNKPAKKYFDV